jgi:protein ImuA
MARILWCWPERWRYETGHLYGPGLARLGLDPGTLLIVETARKADALWALEEGLKSRSLVLAVGVLEDAALTPARRLALAAAEGATPCLLLTSARTPASGATSTRWRIGSAPSAPHLFDAKAPGAARSRVALERNRGAKPGPETSHMLEWSDETHCFRVAADVAHRAPQPALARRRTG